jgi:hypothetical protein
MRRDCGSPAGSKKAPCYTDSFIYMSVFDARFALMVSDEECRHDSTEVLIVNFDYIYNEMGFP